MTTMRLPSEAPAVVRPHPARSSLADVRPTSRHTTDALANGTRLAVPVLAHDEQEAPMTGTTVPHSTAADVGVHAEPLLPGPSKRHATCAWCHRDCGSIVELIDHVDATHVGVGHQAA
jgi:hypothetical protein